VIVYVPAVSVVPERVSSGFHAAVATTATPLWSVAPSSVTLPPMLERRMERVMVGTFVTWPEVTSWSETSAFRKPSLMATMA
jgi:hypothetical protein